MLVVELVWLLVFDYQGDVEVLVVQFQVFGQLVVVLFGVVGVFDLLVVLFQVCQVIVGVEGQVVFVVWCWEVVYLLEQV